MKIQIAALTATIVLALSASVANAQRSGADAKEHAREAGGPPGSALERREQAWEREGEAREEARERETEAREQNGERRGSDADQVRGESPDFAPGRQKQQDNVADRERREEGKGSEQGQEKREEKSRKWWRFWE